MKLREAVKKPYARPVATSLARLIGSINAKSGFFTMDGRELDVAMFHCRNRELRSLDGMPQKVNELDVSNNPLKTLDGIGLVKNGFWARDCQLTTLEVDGKSPFPSTLQIMNVSSNPLKNLKGSPRNLTEEFFANNCALITLEGGPDKVVGEIDFSSNILTSLRGFPKLAGHDADISNNNISEIGDVKDLVILGKLDLSSNNITGLKGIEHQIARCDILTLTNNPIKSHLLGVLKIQDLKAIHIDELGAENIINKYVGKGGSSKIILECQSELLDAGFEEFAQL